jgi:hypothetical protein
MQLCHRTYHRALERRYEEGVQRVLAQDIARCRLGVVKNKSALSECNKDK